MKLCLNCNQTFSTIEWNCPSCDWRPAVSQGHVSFAPQLAAACSGFKPDYFVTLASLEAKNFWFVARNRLILHAIRRNFPKFQNCMEIGCGTGFVLSNIAKAFSGRTYAGSEVYCEGLNFAKARLPSGVELFQMDAQAIPYQGHWDLLAACDVLEHIENDQLAIAQIHQALKPGGGLLITVPQHAWLWSRQDEMACHVRRYSRVEIEEKLLSAGFEILDIQSFVSLLVPMMWLSRKGGKALPKNADPMYELKLPRWLNAALSAVMTLESLMMRCGVRFPVGGSLLVCARKPLL